MEQTIEQIRQNSEEGLDLAGINLKGAKLEDVYLKGAKLKGDISLIGREST